MISEQQFIDEAQEFLDANAARRSETKRVWGEGSDEVAIFTEHTPEQDRAEVGAAKAWRAKVYDAGFGWITGPERWGGRELPAAYEKAYRALEAKYDTPSQGAFGIGLGMIAPTIQSHATEEAKDRYLPAMYRGDIVACQLFSEPGAGSDLAGLQSRAIRDGDEWIITGQKVWTSGAQYSDIGEIICRTDPDLPKHKGLTGFIVDMKAPGVEVRPLRQMTGGASFNEVFFTEVRVPDDHRLGDVNQGWTVALTTLMNERAAIGGAGLGIEGGGTGALMNEMLRQTGANRDPLLRQKAAELYANTQVARYTTQRALAKMAAGQLPGPELSIAKLALTNNLSRISQLVASALGARMTADTGEWGTFSWAGFVLGVPGMRVAGGTDEVMKNIIGERVLGLQKEPKPQESPKVDL
ncbi:MAG TPA: acyl-CoA dehydrogenase family protein [Acidimicrobiales bacterium]|nr:acyl-CoA dehydrogenase family protein [Acidimicrobiales bacterium]